MFESIIRSITDKTADSIMTKMLKDPYEENLFVLITAAQKLSVRAIIEASIRAETGEMLYRPYGSPNVMSQWNKIFLNPTQLFSLPTEDSITINTEVIIGPRAKRPLKISMPVMITGMAYGGSLSMKAKLALAIAASKAGTATNTGEAPLLNEERDAAKLLIGQYNRFNVLFSKEDLSKLDAIEIQLGQGAWGGAVKSSKTPDTIGPEMRDKWHLNGNESTKRSSRFNGVNTPEDIINLVNKLKNEYDVPVGVKIAASHFIEKDLEVIFKTEADFITIDGSEGGTAGAPVALEDDIGLPTLYALSRASNYLKQKNVQDKYNLIIAGGLKTPGDFLKCLALGAKAVYIGSIALVAMLQTQSVKATPSEPTPQLVLYNGKLSDDLDVEKSAKSLENFLKSCLEEMKISLTAMGKSSFDQLNTNDLVTVDKDLSECLKIDYAGFPKQ